MNSAALHIEQLKPGDHARWDAFVHACPSASFFHLSGWKNILENEFGHKTWFLYATQDGQIQAILPLAQLSSRLFGNQLLSLPFCVYGGIADINPAAASLLDLHAQGMARELDVDHLEYRLGQAMHAHWPRSNLYATFRKALDPDPEKNLLAIPRKQRAMVRKGISLGLSSEVEGDTTAFFGAYADSVHRLGTPVFAPSYFRALLREFGAQANVLTVRRQRETVCSVLSFRFRDEIMPYYGGGGALARQLAGHDFMYWEVMRRACEQACTGFDFGRSKFNTGAFDFKKNWGFTPTPLHYEYYLLRSKAVPQRHPLNPRYALAIRAWRAMPLWMANRIGPHLVRHLG